MTSRTSSTSICWTNAASFSHGRVCVTSSPIELVFYERLKHYRCLTTNSGAANMFYIPYYGGLDVLRWHFIQNVSSVQLDGLGLELISRLKDQPSWRRKEGLDHVLVLGKVTWDFQWTPSSGMWGSRLLFQDEMQNLTKLLEERQPWYEDEGSYEHTELGLSLSFHGLRPDRCLHPNTTMDVFIHSEFCMQPPGDSPTRRSLFDSLIAGCVPVLFDPFSAYFQYPWHLPKESESYSVYIPAEDVRNGKVNVIDELRKIPECEVGDAAENNLPHIARAGVCKAGCHFEGNR
ncbi:hypothetical protein L7F22_064042 [Adiantum nelumboides]|nr:hypothetical protein [Adiantum nelumboides]